MIRLFARRRDLLAQLDAKQLDWLKAIGRLAEATADRRVHDGFCTICKSCAVLSKGAAARRAEVDPVAVERAVVGDPPLLLTTAERREAVRILTKRALNYRAIAERLRVATRTVTRDRRHLALVPPLCSSCPGSACRWHTETQVAA